MALITAKSLDDWNTLQLDKWKTLVPNINTNTDSMVSMDANVISEVAYLLEQDLITQTNNAFLAYAIWDELSNLWNDRWIPRKSASISTGTATFSRTSLATVNYPIYTWTLISTVEDSEWVVLTFRTTANWTIYWVVWVPTWLWYTAPTTWWSITNWTRVYTVTALSWDGTETNASWSVSVVISNWLTTNSTVLTWTPVSIAASYNIYLWANLLWNSTSATYTDTVWTTWSIVTAPVSNNTWKTSVTIAIESTATWVINNVWIGSITKIIEIPTWVETVNNTVATTWWLDEEIDSVYRDRLKVDLANNFWKTTVAWYRRTATSVTWVANATVLHEVWNPANEISVFIIATWSDPIPSAWLITTVQTELDLDENRAVCDSIVVKAPTLVAIAITMAIISYDTTYTQPVLTQLIKDTLSAYLLWLWVWAVVRVVDIANIIHDIDAVVDFTLSLPTVNTTLTSTQIANIWTVTVTY